MLAIYFIFAISQATWGMLFADDKCVVCFCAKATIMFKPCHHVSTCHRCGIKSKELKKCPLCMAEIRERLDISIEQKLPEKKLLKKKLLTMKYDPEKQELYFMKINGDELEIRIRFPCKRLRLDLLGDFISRTSEDLIHQHDFVLDDASIIKFSNSWQNLIRNENSELELEFT